MPVRTAIPVTAVTSFQRGTNLSVVAGDAANDHTVDLTYAPKLCLIARNLGGNTVAFTVELAAGNKSYQTAVSKSWSVGASNVLAAMLDMPPDLAQSGYVLNIDSTDANFGDLRFMAFTWTDTPSDGNTGYRG